MSNCRKKVFEVQVTQQRAVISDPLELAAAVGRWERSMAILFELQDKYEAGQADKVSYSNITATEA